MHRFANPNRFLRLSAAVLPWTAGLSAALMVVGLYLALVASPPDFRQSETVRIMYIHVPAAWLAVGGYAAMAVCSAVGFIWKHPLADLVCKAIAPIGAAFTAVCLATGSIWGEPTWGTWWVWDARLTSVLILLFLYLGYLALVSAFDDPARGLKAGAILTMVGAINLPVIKFSVDWWNTLHQPASIRPIQVLEDLWARLSSQSDQYDLGAVDPATVGQNAVAISSSMLWPLLVMTAAFTAFFVAITLLNTRAEILDRKIQVLRAAQAYGASR